MATIKVIEGSKKFVGKNIPIPVNIRESEDIFRDLANDYCFWEIDLLGLSENDVYELMIIDFATRCARSICMGIPIFIDEQRIIVLSVSKKSVDNALRKVTNLLAVSGGNMRIARDDKQGLKIETIPNIEDDDFAEGMFFANA